MSADAEERWVGGGAWSGGWVGERVEDGGCITLRKQMSQPPIDPISPREETPLIRHRKGMVVPDGDGGHVTLVPQSFDQCGGRAIRVVALAQLTLAPIAP